MDLILGFILGFMACGSSILLWCMMARCAELDNTDEWKRGIRRS